MTEWKEYKLGDLIQSVSDTYRFKPNEKVVFLNTSDILDGKFLTNSLSDVKTLPGQAKKRIQKGDILFSEIRPANKRFALVNFDCDNYVVSTKLMVLRCNENVDNRFIYTYLTSSEVLDYLQMVAEDRSGTFPQITFDIIAKMDIELPPLPTQRRIAAILSSLDDKIDLLHRENATLEQMAETLFRQWFVVEAKEEWEEKPLSSIAIFLNGLACQKYPPKNEIDKLPVLKIRELSSGIGNDSDWATTDVGVEYIVHAGDVIFAWSASLMVKIWDGEDCILNQHLFKVTSDKYPKWFYYFWCKHHLDEFISIAQSHATTMGHIKRNDLDTAMVLVPSDEELLSMTAQMEGLLRKMENNNEQINTLIQTRDGLLPRLMNNEVKI